MAEKVAVVTGGGNGVGQAVALALASEGAKVVVNDIAKDADGNSAADRVVKEITEAKGSAVANYESVATMSGGENIIKSAIINFGRIDILVTCAGNYRRARTVEMTEEDWDATIDVHLKGTFSCSKAAVGEMIKQKSGRIITISSRGGFLFDPASGGVAYAAAKAGILGLTARLSGELKEYGITVNAILPSADTKLFPGRTPRWFGGGTRETPDFIPPIIVYLATNEAQNITGRFFYACAGDICLFDRPMQLPGPHMFIRKPGKWTIEELSEIIPPMIK